jgi:hypothetical protein
MKVVNDAKQTFKKVSAKQVELNPQLADRLGKQRPAVTFDLPVWEASDMEVLATEHSATMLTCLNAAIAQLAKEQFAANPVDWEFKPTVESLSLEALAASFEATSRGRVLTLESAGKLAAWLQSNIAALVTGVQAIEPEYKAVQATAIIAVIAKYTAYEAKGADYLAKVTLRLEQMSEAIAGDDQLIESFSEQPELAQVFDALMRKFSKSIEDEVSEDAL